MNREHRITEAKGTHLDHNEKGADGTKNGLGWCDARYFLREIQDVDGHVQRGDDIIAASWWFGIGICVHGPKLAQPREMLKRVGRKRGAEPWTGQGVPVMFGAIRMKLCFRIMRSAHKCDFRKEARTRSGKGAVD